MKKFLCILLACAAVFSCKKGEDNIKYDVVTIKAEVSGTNITLSGKLGPDIDEAEVTSVGFLVSEDKNVPESGSKDFAATLQSEFQKKVTVADLDNKSATTFYFRAYAKGDSKTWLGQIKAFATEKKAVTKVEVNPSVLAIAVKQKATLTAKITPSDASFPKVSWSSSDKKIATVSESGEVTGVAKGKCEITATADGVKGTCSVTVRGAVPEGFKDLGLSVYWAEKNLGANSPSETGSYYQWGKTYPVTESNITSYYNNYTIPTDYQDAATAINKSWRTPTSDEFQEMRDNCTMSKETLNGVACVRFTSKINNEYIVFSSATGVLHINDYYDGAKKYGYYRTKTSRTYYNGMTGVEETASPNFRVYSEGPGAIIDNNFSLKQGIPVRPVTD